MAPPGGDAVAGPALRAPRPTRLRQRLRPASAAAIALALACERGAPEAAIPEPQAVDAAPRVFELRGTPGPWTRPGASQLDFDTASRACLARSRAARQQTPPEGRADAAYRAFLDCMEAGSWRRGGRAPSAGVTPPAAPR
jgi:hypothetical protein